jgi:hypothetical protein
MAANLALSGRQMLRLFASAVAAARLEIFMSGVDELAGQDHDIEILSLLELAAEPALLGRLQFAGEHTSTDFLGFMNGGVQSGNRASAALITKSSADGRLGRCQGVLSCGAPLCGGITFFVVYRGVGRPVETRNPENLRSLAPCSREQSSFV